MVSANQAWPAREPTVPGLAADSSSVQDGRLAASSIIDMNALPDWLHSSGGQQSASETSSQPYSAPYAGPPRVENMRVPSRPRGEISSSETSEMAASVFASMLGVASTAPNFPPPTGVPYQQQPGQLTYAEQMSLSGVSAIAGMPGQAGTSIAGIGNPGGASMTGIAGGSGAQSMTGNAYRNPTGGPSGSGAQGMADEEKNTKKRGLFGALLDWLSR